MSARASGMQNNGGKVIPGKGRVLLVDDEESELAAAARHLRRAGFGVETSESASTAVDRVRGGGFDAVVTDLAMPEMDGIALLRAIRQDDRDIPVLIVTGYPSLATAAAAVELGAFKYLIKPFEPKELVQALSRATQLCRLARAKREALSLLGGTAGEASDRAGLEASFASARDSIWIAFQPILDASKRTIFGYEALLRSEEPSLPHPGAVVDAADRLGVLNLLGRTVRRLAAEPMHDGDPTWLLFLNLHPEDLLDIDLADGSTTLGKIAHQVVLEITERASLDRISDLRRRVAQLREAGFRIAIDDVGTGYAGLSSFLHLEPEFVKLDMSLVRGVHESASKRKLVQYIAKACTDLGLDVVAEGVETAEERDVVVELGCTLLQGYRFARPARPFAAAAW